MAITTATGRPLAPYEYAESVLLLEVTWAGRVFRFASQRIDATDDDGTWQYAPGLTDRWERSAALLEDEPADDIDLGEVVFPVDVALWHAQGRDLTDAEAVLSLWVSGRALERRHILARGTVSAARYGAGGDPVSLTMRPPLLDDAGTLLPPEASVSADTWPDAAGSAIGQPYPIVFGKPGLGSGVEDELRGGTPALLVEVTAPGKWLIADGRVAATSVTIIEVDGSGATSTQSATVTHETDGLGRTVATVDGTGGAVGPVQGDRYYIDWSATAGLGGVLRDGGSAAVLGAGDVCLWLLQRSSVPWSRGQWQAIAPELNRYRLSFYVDQDAAPLAILRDEVLPLLPVTLTVGPEGISPVLWRLDATTLDAVAVLEEGRNCWAASDVEITRDGLRNEIRLDYAPDADGSPYKSRAATGRDVGADAPGVWSTLLARSSRLRTGRDYVRSIDTPNVYDDATADRILSWMIAAYALPHLRITYDVSPELAHLSPGDVVSLTDSLRHWTTRVALVEAIAWEAGVVSLSVVLVPSPARDSRPTS